MFTDQKVNRMFTDKKVNSDSVQYVNFTTQENGLLMKLYNQEEDGTHEDVASEVVGWDSVFNATFETLKIQEDVLSMICEDMEGDDDEEEKRYKEQLFRLVNDGLKPEIIKITGKTWDTLKTAEEKKNRIWELIDMFYDDEVFDNIIEELVDEAFEDID